MNTETVGANLQKATVAFLRRLFWNDVGLKALSRFAGLSPLDPGR